MTTHSRYSLSGSFAHGLMILIIGAGVGWGHSQDSADEFTRLKALFNERVVELETRVNGEKTAMLQSYGKILGRLQEELQAEGELESVLMIRKEIEATRAGQLSVIEDPEQLPSSLRRPREIAATELERSDKEMAASLRDLKNKYVSALEGMKTAYTKAGKLELAMSIAAEIEAHRDFQSAVAAGAPRSLMQLPTSLQSGLMVWFPLDEDDGTKVKDLGKRSLVGELVGTQFTADGVIGGARKFGGQGDRITIGDGIPDSKRFTVSVWIKYSGIAGKGGIFSDYDGKFGNDLMLALVSAHEVHLRADKSGDKLRTESVLPEALTQEWHHLVWVVDSRETVLYIDGVEAVRHEGEGSNRGFHGAHLGFANDGRAWSYFEGEIDEFMMWDRVLTEPEIEAIHQLNGH